MDKTETLLLNEAVCASRLHFVLRALRKGRTPAAVHGLFEPGANAVEAYHAAHRDLTGRAWDGMDPLTRRPVC